jgi:hypothetical protein
MTSGLAIDARAAWIVATCLLLPGPVTGDEGAVEVKSCVYIRQIRNTDIIDDRTIVFHMAGTDIFLNRLPNRCPGLKIADSFMYATSLTRLCNVDIISPLRQQHGGFRRGPSCGLGRFEPTTREEIALLKNKDIEIDEDAAMPDIETLDETGASADEDKTPDQAGDVGAE